MIDSEYFQLVLSCMDVAQSEEINEYREVSVASYTHPSLTVRVVSQVRPATGVSITHY